MPNKKTPAARAPRRNAKDVIHGPFYLKIEGKSYSFTLVPSLAMSVPDTHTFNVQVASRVAKGVFVQSTTFDVRWDSNNNSITVRNWVGPTGKPEENLLLATRLLFNSGEVTL